MKKLLIAFASLIILSGCTQRIGDFTVASTKNMDLNNSDIFIADRVEGNDTKPIILFPLGIPSMKEATDQAIEKDRCAVGLSDVTITSGFFSFFVGAVWYDVEGNLIIDKAQPGCADWVYDPAKFSKK